MAATIVIINGTAATLASTTAVDVVARVFHRVVNGGGKQVLAASCPLDVAHRQPSCVLFLKFGWTAL